MATIRERISSLLGFRSKQLDVESFGTASNYWTYATSGETDKLLKILYNNGVDQYDEVNPRSKVKLSRTMDEVFPFVRRAINDMANMVGNVVLVSDTVKETALEDLNELLSELPILSESDWQNPHEKGIDNLIFRIVRTVLLDGMVFCQDRYNEGNLRDYQGVLLFESLHFDFEQTDANKPIKLRYLANQYPTDDPLHELFFHKAGYDFVNNYPWANPLLAGGGFFSHILTAMLVAIRNINARKGAPVEVSLIGLKDDSRLQDTNTKTAYKGAMDDIHKMLKFAADKQLSGQPSNVVANLPMDITLLSKAFGTDALSEVDPELLKMVLVAFASLLDVPIEFLGIVIGSSGFSPERFKILYKIWGSKIDNLRTKFKPIIKLIIDNYLRSLGVNPSVIAALDIEFLNAEIRDEKEIAENNKTDAEADKIRTEVAANLSQVDTAWGVRYLEWHGLNKQ